MCHCQVIGEVREHLELVRTKGTKGSIVKKFLRDHNIDVLRVRLIALLVCFEEALPAPALQVCHEYS